MSPLRIRRERWQDISGVVQPGALMLIDGLQYRVVSIDPLRPCSGDWYDLELELCDDDCVAE